MSIEIIAEIGVNHNGLLGNAMKLVDAAKAAGCDTAKFQLWSTERVYPRERWDEMKRLELSRNQIEHLKDYCDASKIEFLCTPQMKSRMRYFSKSIGVKRIKTSSQDSNQFAIAGINCCARRLPNDCFNGRMYAQRN